MANTAVTVDKLVRNSFVASAASTGLSAVLSTANTYFIPFAKDGKVAFLVNWNCCEASTEYAKAAVVQHGDFWRNGVGGVTHTDFTLWSTSCGVHTWFLGPFESAQFGCLSTSTSYGAELGEFYLNVYFVNTSSSGADADSTATAVTLGDAYIRGFQFPGVVYSS